MGKVYLCGAGPGDLDFMSIRVKHLIEKCDVLIYDALVDTTILETTTAQTIYVGKRAGKHALAQEAINQLLIEKGRTSIVVRLKGGDPFVFGRGGEECMALEKAHIPYEVIPGISSAIAVPETMGIPLTHRSISRSFSVITGHTKSGKVDVSAYAKIPGTLVFLMSVGTFSQIAKDLIQQGKPGSMPVAILCRGTREDAYRKNCTLETVDEALQDPKVGTPAVIVVGKVAAMDLRSQAPSVCVCGTERFTRSFQDQCPTLCVRQPYLQIVFHTDKKINFQSYSHVVLTGKTAIDGLFRMVDDIRQISHLQFVTIGPSSAKYLYDTYHIHADWIPLTYTSDGLADLLCGLPDANLLILRAQKANLVLSNRLDAAGIAYTQIPVYDTVVGQVSDIHEDFAVFGSAQGVHAFFKQGGHIDPHTTVLAIGPYTQAALVAHDMQNIQVAKQATISSLIQKWEECL